MVDKNEIFGILDEVLGTDITGIYIDELTSNSPSISPVPFVFKNDTCVKRIQDSDCVKIDAGLTKVVLIMKNKDYVIKIPLSGACISIKGAPMQIYSRVFLEEDNVLEDEVNLYNDCSTLGKKVILPLVYVGEWNGLPIYIQQKIAKTGAEYKDEVFSTEGFNILDDEESQKFFEKAINLGCEIDTFFFSDIIRWYGFETAKMLLMDCGYISDLHSGNYGYQADGRPVIFDIGGYDEEYFHFAEEFCYS